MSLQIKELLLVFAFMFTVTIGQSVDYNVTTLKEDIDNFKDEAQYQINVIRSMYDEIQAESVRRHREIKTEINSLRIEDTVMEDKINILKTEKQEMQSEISTLNQQIEALQDQVKRIKESDVPRVAFSAYMNTAHYHPSTGETVPFHKVLLNKGDYYSTGTSKFTCPITATYFFIFNLYSSSIRTGTNGERVEASLRRSNSNSQLAAVYCHNDNYYNIWMQCTNSAVIKCDSGEKVWVQAWGVNNQMYGYQNAKRSTFSGFILWK